MTGVSAWWSALPLRGMAASPLGFLVGLPLGALGGGGSVLAVPALVYAAGQAPHQATASSLVLVGTAAMVGLLGHLRAGRVRVGTGMAFGAAGIPGSVAGSLLNRRLDPDALLLAFAGLMLVAAWRMRTGCPTCTRIGEQRAVDPAGTGGRTREDAGGIPAVIAAGTAVGLLTGLLGVGGGFVIVPALTLVLRLPMPSAIGTSLLVVAVNTTVALGARLPADGIDWAVTLPFAAAAMGGVVTGGRLADRIHPERSLRWFAALLVAVAGLTATEALLG